VRGGGARAPDSLLEGRLGVVSSPDSCRKLRCESGGRNWSDSAWKRSFQTCSNSAKGRDSASSGDEVDVAVMRLRADN
jgi:hypothetical protein